MTTAITVLFLVGLFVFLSMLSPASTFLDPPPVDRDLERLRTEGRTHY